MADVSRIQLHWADYAVFSLMLVLSLSIGVFHSLTGGRQRTTGEYLLGGNKIGLWPVVISLTVSYSSAITLLGYPAEMYAFGGQMIWTCVALILAGVAAVYLFLPVMYPLRLTTVNEYIMMRYESRLVMTMSSLFAVVQFVFWTGLVIFTPAQAIQSATGIPAWSSIVITSAVTITYSTIGGYRAVIWTDVFQSVIMYAGVLLILIQSIMKTGGFSEMWRVAGEWGRLDIVDFDPDPTKRMNIYGAIFGNALSYLAVYGYQQIGFQRYTSMEDIGKARKVMLYMIPGGFALKFLSLACGVTVFAYYAKLGCDPKEAGYITSYNQVMTYFIANAVPYPGVAGVFIAAVYAASLSSASSALNSAAACIWRDLLKDRLHNISEARAAVVTKILTVAVGLLGLCFAFAANLAGGTVIQVGGTFGATVGGPLGSLFLMGIFLPWINVPGICVGCISGMAFSLWISLGSYMMGGKNWNPLPVPTYNCDASQAFVSNVTSNMFTNVVTTTSSLVQSEPVGLNRLYSISFLWMREVVSLVVVSVTVIVSGITGFRSPKTLDSKLVHPILKRWITFKDTQDDIYEIKQTEKSGSYTAVPYDDPVKTNGVDSGDCEKDASSRI